MLSEEEKQAIEYLNECIIKENLFEEDFTLHQINIVLNCITKLKKENKELNRLLKFSLDYRHKLEEDLYEGASNFILRKDKIREIIEEYKHKDFIKMQVVMKHDKEALKIVEVLEKILGDE